MLELVSDGGGGDMVVLCGSGKSVLSSKSLWTFSESLSSMDGPFFSGSV